MTCDYTKQYTPTNRKAAVNQAWVNDDRQIRREIRRWVNIVIFNL